MSRKIMFRAWDGSNMITFDNHAFDLIFNDISGWNVCPNVPNYKGAWTTGESSKTADKFALMQYTGLKDGNGKDIYEGDNLQEKMGEYTFNGEVKFGETTHYPDHYGVCFVGWYVDNSLDSELNFSTASNFKIIGNIHQNPNLLP